MNNYKNIINRNDLKVNKVTYKKDLTIISTPLGQFVLKKNKGNNIYNYLLSRGFNYLPKIIDYDSDSILYEYIEEIDYDSNEKARDFIKLLSLLHTKTSYFIDIDQSVNKSLYEDLKDRLVKLNNYYNSLINEIDMKEYPSPEEYLVSRNVSIIFSAINYSLYMLDRWIEIVKNKNKKRVVTNYNNNKLSNMIKSIDNMYLTSIDNTKIDSPIIDLVSFYNNYYDKFDFMSLLTYYDKYYPLLEEEIIMFKILISIPNKIKLNNITDIKECIDKIYKVLEILSFKEEKETSAHKNKDNKK